MAKHAGGRPPIEIDIKKFELLCLLPDVSLAFLAEFFECSEDTIERFVKKNYEKSFAEYKNKRKAIFKAKLLSTQIKLAEKSAAMAIFLGKNYLGQSDRQETILSAGTPAPERLVFDFGAGAGNEGENAPGV